MVARKITPTMESRVLHYIRRHCLLNENRTVVVAVSGGADSVCLLHLLSQYQAELGISLCVAHLNHGLRGDESDEDASYVAGLADSLGLDSIIGQRDVALYRRRKRCSLEEAAREVRYGFLADVARSVKANHIAIGHTRDDNVETILLHLLRGSGTNGLRGLQPMAPMAAGKGKTPFTVIRPLLETTRGETQDYCRRFKLKPRTDSSNLSTVFLRNRIRLELIPLLREYNPAIDEAMLRLADIAAADTAFIEEQAAVIWSIAADRKGKIIYLDREIVSGAPRAIQRQLFRMATTKLAGNLRDIEASHIEDMICFLDKPAGKEFTLPGGVQLSTEYGRLALSASRPKVSPPLDGEYKIAVPGETTLPGWRIATELVKEPYEDPVDTFTAYFDLNKTGTDLTVRSRRHGDRFQPFGMDGSRKLQDFMVDAKIPRLQRDDIPLLCSPRQILWVAGYRTDERVKVTDRTKKILKVTFERVA
jgi:tRNA(Ile)-lysidine synthase